MDLFKNILWVGAGGGIGSILRYLCQKWFAEKVQHPFPWGTFIVNISGCLLIGILYTLSERSTLLSPQTRLLLITGLCGGFTTFSAFAFENMSLLRSGDMFYFFLYAIGTVILGIAAVFGGVFFMKLL
jgi:fluoride exporter